MHERAHIVPSQARKFDEIFAVEKTLSELCGKPFYLVRNELLNVDCRIVAVKYYVSQLQSGAKSFIPGISRDDILKLSFIMPPLAEQTRIVNRVEELFEQVDIIEQNQADIDTLYDEFRKRTLTLAIQGKLVPQDPNDEPASVLLERIRAEKKAKLGKKYVDSYIYKGDDNCYYEHIATRAQDELVEVPFDLPNNWAWAKLLDIGNFSSGKTPDMSEPAYWQNGNVQWFTSKDMKTKYLTESQLKITELAANDMTLYPANTLLWVVRSGILKSSLPICILKQSATICHYVYFKKRRGKI